MDDEEAARALGALAHPTRMRVFRTLAAVGEAGMGSSDIADTLGVPPNLMSSHLSILADSGVLSRRASGRSRIYSVRGDAVAALAHHLLSLLR